MEFETSYKDVISVKVDRKRRSPVSMLLRAMGNSTDDEILELFEDVDVDPDHPYMKTTVAKDTAVGSHEEALLEFQRGVGSARAEERQRFHEVDRWVDSADTDLPFAFESICSSLLIDPDYIRSGLRRLKQQAFSGQPTPVARRLRRGRIYHRRGWRGQIG